MSSRLNNLFRPSMLEVFEDRITPSTAALPGQIPIIPRGQDLGVSGLLNNGQYSVTSGTNGGFFTVSGDTVSTTITQNTNATHSYVLVAYTAPGGGANLNSTAYDNYSSQKLVYQSAPVVLASGGTATFSVDLSQLNLTGQQKVAFNIIQIDGSTDNFQAPKKAIDMLNSGTLVYGELFDYDNPGVQHGKGK